MSKKIGFIGCGNMGSAMLNGILDAKLVNHNQIMVSCASVKSANRIHDLYNVITCNNNIEVASACDFLILAIKPNMFECIIDEIKDVAKDKVIISVAAGITMDAIESLFDYDCLKVARAMPNTPASVMMAMSSLSFNSHLKGIDQAYVVEIFESFGKVEVVDESLIHAVIGISGSSCAYIFMVLDAMIQNGMKHGLTKEKATKFACQSVMGSAKMVSVSNESADQLKQNVCSPGGTTIEAVKTLEEYKIYEAFDMAMDACINKSKILSK